MDINAAFPSNYIKASDLQGRDVTVTISHVTLEDIGGDHKPVMYFKGKDKGLVLNKTNSNAIAGMYGNETDAWADKPITIFPTQTDFQGKITPCIRVKLTPPAQSAPVQTPPPSNTLDDEIPF